MWTGGSGKLHRAPLNGSNSRFQPLVSGRIRCESRMRLRRAVV
jgi:hypothetical protein